jgi:hypothetical protein
LQGFSPLLSLTSSSIAGGFFGGEIIHFFNADIGNTAIGALDIRLPPLSNKLL